MRAEELLICLLYMRRRALGRDWREHRYEHGCARAVNSLEPILLIFSTGAVKATPTAPPTKTLQIRQTTDDDDDDDFVHESSVEPTFLQWFWWFTHVTHATSAFTVTDRITQAQFLTCQIWCSYRPSFPSVLRFFTKMVLPPRPSFPSVLRFFTKMVLPHYFQWECNKKKEEKVFFAATGWLGLQGRQTFEVFFVFVSLFYWLIFHLLSIRSMGKGV